LQFGLGLGTKIGMIAWQGIRVRIPQPKTTAIGRFPVNNFPDPFTTGHLRLLSDGCTWLKIIAFFLNETWFDCSIT
jgi:hypothetical protein